MTTNPYYTKEPYLWAGPYLVYQGKIVGYVDYQEQESNPWHSVFCINDAGELIDRKNRNPQSDRDRAVTSYQAGAMLRLEDWLKQLIFRNRAALERFVGVG